MESTRVDSACHNLFGYVKICNQPAQPTPNKHYHNVAAAQHNKAGEEEEKKTDVIHNIFGYKRLAFVVFEFNVVDVVVVLAQKK